MHRHRRPDDFGPKIQTTVLLTLLTLSCALNPPPWWWWAALALTLAWTVADMLLPEGEPDCYWCEELQRRAGMEGADDE